MVMNRRNFLNSSLGGVTAAMLYGVHAQGQEEKTIQLLPQSPRETLFLTWREDPTTTMSIQWIGSGDPKQMTVGYAPLDKQVLLSEQTIAKPYNGTDLSVFRCELTNLEPGTEYKFQIQGEMAEYRFRTMPAKATDSFTFVSGGDAGVGPHAIATNKLAAKQDPYFALIAGDLAYDNGRSPETFYQFLVNYSRDMIDSEGRLIPLITCLGNHEVNGSYKTQRKDALSYLTVFDGFYSEKTFGALDFGDYLSLVILDTDHIAPIGGEQTDWLEKTLAQRVDCPHLIVANHVPAYPSHRPPETGDKPGTGAENRKHWCPLFEKYKVDLVLEHHDHTFKRTHPLTDGRHDKYGVLYLGDGSWGKLRVPKTPEERPYLAKVSQAYHVTVHHLEGDRRYHVALEDSGKIADVCTTVSKRASRRG